MLDENVRETVCCLREVTAGTFYWRVKNITRNLIAEIFDSMFTYRGRGHGGQFPDEIRLHFMFEATRKLGYFLQVLVETLHCDLILQC